MQNEEKLRELVLKWTNQFKWRKDFLKWQEERIWQEKYQERIINFLERFIPDLKNKKILDLGCGMGGFLVAMKKRGYDIEGLEPNPDYREIALLRGKRYGLEIKVTAGFGEKMPFPNNTFDFIFCNNVLEHCENPIETLKESYRILRKDGQMYVTVINRFGFEDPHYHLRFINWMPRILGEYLIKIRGLPKENLAGRQKLSDMHYFTYWQFQNLAKKIGFEVLDLRKYKISHPELIDDQKIRKIVKLLNCGKLNLLIYFLFCFLYFSSFIFILRKI